MKMSTQSFSLLRALKQSCFTGRIPQHSVGPATQYYSLIRPNIRSYSLYRIKGEKYKPEMDDEEKHSEKKKSSDISKKSNTEIQETQGKDTSAVTPTATNTTSTTSTGTKRTPFGTRRPKKLNEPIYEKFPNPNPTLVSPALSVAECKERGIYRYPTNLRWTEQETARLQEALSKFGPGHWTKISEFVKSKSPIQCSRRWDVINPANVLGKYSPEEDEIIRKGVKRYGTAWVLIAQELPGRKPESIRKHWERQLKPTTSTSSFTLDDDYLVVIGVLRFGFRWAYICDKLLPRRRGNAVSMRFDNLFGWRLHGREIGMKPRLRNEFERQLSVLESLSKEFPNFMDLQWRVPIVNQFKSYVKRKSCSTSTVRREDGYITIVSESKLKDPLSTQWNGDDDALLHNIINEDPNGDFSRFLLASRLTDEIENKLTCAFPDRSMKEIFERIEVLRSLERESKDEIRIREWTIEEEHQLKTLHEQVGDDWVAIGKEMKRFAPDVEARFKMMRSKFDLSLTRLDQIN